MLAQSTLAVLETASPSEGSQLSWVAMILREFGRSQATGFVLDVVKWTLLGALLGVVVAVVSCFLFSRLGWYDVRWRFARGLRWSVFILTVVLSAVLFALVGTWSGAISGSARVLSRSQLATDVFPKLANTIADGMAWVQVQAELNGDTNRVELTTRLDEFRAGEWELHAARFLQQLDALQEDTITNAIGRLVQSALEHIPQFKGGTGEKLLHQFFSRLGRLVVEKKVSSELKKYGADRVYFAIRENLISEAGKAGNPDTIAREEISAFLIRDGIVPGILKPIRTTARSQQLPLIVIALAVLVVPPLCLRLAKSRFGRKHDPAVPTPPQVGGN